VSPTGVATMLDKYGGVFEAVERPDGSYSINSKPRAYLGPGRPLGAGFNADGDLYVCDALKVGGGRCSGGGGCKCQWGSGAGALNMNMNASSTSVVADD
jgi:hypothetical protein